MSIIDCFSTDNIMANVVDIKRITFTTIGKKFNYLTDLRSLILEAKTSVLIRNDQNDNTFIFENY